MRREFMIEFREKYCLTIQDMAKMSRVPKSLLELMEASDTDFIHPNMAKRIGKAYKLNREQIEGLMPEHHRKSSPNYNPNLFKSEEYEYGKFEVWNWARFM